MNANGVVSEDRDISVWVTRHYGARPIFEQD